MTSAKDLMTENPTTVRESAKLREAAASFQDLDARHLPVVNARGELIELMLEHKVGAVPVADADGVLVGIISYVDLLRVLGELEAAAEAAQ